MYEGKKLCCWCDLPATERTTYAGISNACCVYHKRLYDERPSVADVAATVLILVLTALGVVSWAVVIVALALGVA
jgi:hypothetical protein